MELLLKFSNIEQIKESKMELKFRAWHENSYITWDEYSTCNFVDKPAMLGDFLVHTKINNVIIEQYIGLKDINDKEIYFNSDIVKATFEDGLGLSEDTVISGVIYLNLKRFKICIKGHENFDLAFADELEVIGNIHQNPELL